jgi:hypothetical protein
MLLVAFVIKYKTNIVGRITASWKLVAWFPISIFRRNFQERLESSDFNNALSSEFTSPSRTTARSGFDQRNGAARAFDKSACSNFSNRGRQFSLNVKHFPSAQGCVE